MEKQQVSKNSLPLEPALTDLILKSNSEKIRRPPNAFMLFARDHRRMIANQHPNVCNKTVSTILGKVWKSAPVILKSQYYEKSKMLEKLHKRQYPNYVYSPREARIQKMNRKKRNKEVSNYVGSLHQNEELRADSTTETKDEENLNEEGCMTAVDPDPKPGPVYVPNNPGYFIHESPDMNSDDEQEFDEQPPQCGCPMDFQCQSEPRDTLNKTVEGWDHDDKDGRGQPSPGMCRCCDRSKFGFQEKPISPHQMPERERRNSYNPDYLRCTYASPATFCNSPGHFSRPMSPYCCSPPPCSSQGLRPYGPPFHPYWNLPTMNSSYCPRREHVYENLKPCPTSYHTPDYFSHKFGCFDRHASQLNQKPSYKFWPPFNGKPGTCQQEQNEHTSKDSESLPGFSRYVNKGNNYSHSCTGNSTVDEEMVPYNERIVRTNIRNKEDMKNQNLGCGRGSRMHESANPLSSGPVTEDEIYSKEEYGDNLSQKEIKNEIPVNNFVSRQKYQPCVADNIGGKNESIFADFRNCIAHVRPQESSNCAEFSESNSNQNKFRVCVRSEETSNLPGSSESNNDGNNFKNMYVTDIPPKLSKVSSSLFCDSSKIHSWSTPAMKSDLSDNISQQECNTSLSKLDESSISGSVQNKKFNHNKLSTNTLSTVVRSNYTDHNQNDLENTECNHSMEMQCKAPNQTTMEVHSDLHNYLTQITQEISKKELLPENSISMVKIEENSPI